MKEMPFKKRNGQHYFEKVEAFELYKPDEANYLALCPVCAAKYKEFIVLNPGDERNKLQQVVLNSEDYDVPLTLGDEENASVHFAPAHLVDIRAVLKSLSDEIGTNLLAT